jgi:hypothetical protein
MKSNILIVTSLCFITLTACTSAPSADNDRPTRQSDTINVSTSTATSAATEPATPTSAWTYSTEQDKMGGAAEIAQLNSPDVLDFDFPYNGGATAMLFIRKTPEHGTDVILMISKGQFHNSYGNNNVRLRFDNEKPITVSYNESADASTDKIFLNGAQSIIGRLKKAKKLVIEAGFYQAGSRQMEFNVEGLKWPIPEQ